ncbi:hypothetical protein ACTD5D_21675 [Nocardia takedensis]|uniref:hypothetical protein n=1 Tax=Nocardia takedensis TaxID=259390 RepID=UPI003F7742E2
MDVSDNSGTARQEAEARWGGPNFEATQIDNIGAAVLASWCTRAGLVVTDSSTHNALFHAIVADPAPEWTLPIAIKVPTRNSIEVVRDQLDFAGVFVYVFLGRHDGGQQTREHTTILVLDPHAAWRLPRADPDPHRDDAPARMWPLTPALAELLAPDLATSPEQLRAVLARHGWRKPPSD